MPAALLAALQRQRPRRDKSTGHGQSDQKAELEHFRLTTPRIFQRMEAMVSESKPKTDRAKMSLTSKPGDVVTVGDVVIRFRSGRRVTVERPASQPVKVEHESERQ